MNPLTIALAVAAGIFGVVLFGKVIWALANTTLILSDTVVSWFSMMVNFLALVAAIVVPALGMCLLAILFLMGFQLLIVHLKKIGVALADLPAVIKKQIEASTSQFLPLLLAGVMQVLVLVLSKDFVPGSTKVVFTVFLWVGTTLLLLTTSSQGARRLIGVIGLLFSTVLTGAFVLLRYDLTTAGRGRVLLEGMRDSIAKLSRTDLMAVALIVLLLLLLIVTAAVQALSSDADAGTVAP